MEITEHQANMLRALADKKALQYRKKVPTNSESFPYSYANVVDVDAALGFIMSDLFEVRIKPDVIVVNGIEVPAPEKVAPVVGKRYFVPLLGAHDLVHTCYWARGGGDTDDLQYLERGLVHLCRENAAAHSKALLAHKPG